MNQIMIGQYIPGDSWLHKLDPRIKLLSVFSFLIAIFLVPIGDEMSKIYWSVGILVSLLVLVLIITKSAKVSVFKMLRSLRSIIILLTFTFVIQILSSTEGNTVLGPIDMHISVVSITAIILIIVFYQFTKRYIKFRMLYFLLAVVAVFYVQSIPYTIFDFSSYVLNIRDVGIMRSVIIFLRITTIIITTSLLTFTTMTTDLNYGVEELLKPLKVIKVPVDIFAMLLSLTLRYIPTLLIETEKIMKAQASRGVDFNESSLREKVMQIISLLIPVFVISFNRSEDLANAMEVKCYVIGAKRTKIDQYRIRFTDYLTAALSVMILAATIYFKVMIG